MRFEGKTAVVTGAAAGIGAATARRLAAEGAFVVLADIAAEAGEKVAAEIVADGGRAHFCRADVADAADWANLFRQTHDVVGPADIVHSNAFHLVDAPLLRQSPEQWARQIEVNLGGLYQAARTFLPDLTARAGVLIATSSVHALFGLPGHPAYAASKGAIDALVRQLAVEYGPRVRVNAVLPGPIRTQLWDAVDDAGLAAAAKATALRRVGAPEEVAAAVAFLASADASYITGVSLLVDGGWSVQKDSP